MVVVALVAILAGLATYSFTRLLRSNRLSGDRFTIANAIDFAKQRAMARGRDVYVIFANLNRTDLHPSANAPSVIVYDDVDMTMRDNLDGILGGINPRNVRERFVASEAESLAFRDGTPNQVPPCNLVGLPVYLTITRTANQGSCAPAACSFCEDQAGTGVGAVRFSPDGSARIVTGPDGSGGFLKLVARQEQTNFACLAITEPSGYAIALKN